MTANDVAKAVAIKIAFDAMNVYGDGFVTKEELGNLLRQIRGQISDELIEESFKKVDRDNSGYITFDEFLKACKQGLLD